MLPRPDDEGIGPGPVEPRSDEESVEEPARLYLLWLVVNGGSRRHRLIIVRSRSFVCCEMVCEEPESERMSFVSL